MATLREKRKFAALNKENCGEHPRSNLAQRSNVRRSQKDYTTQDSDEIEGRVTKKLSQEFSRTDNRSLGALSHLDDILMYPLLQSHCGTPLETSRNAYGTNCGRNEDDSQSEPLPDASLLQSQTTLNSGLEDGHDTMHLTFGSFWVCWKIRVSMQRTKADNFFRAAFYKNSTVDD